MILLPFLFVLLCALGFYTSTPRQRQAGKTTVGSRRQSCFAVEEPGAGDRRGNKSELTIANYNAEWLFLSPSHPSGAMKCPGKDCTWKVGGVLAWGGVKKPLRTGEKPLVFSDSLLIPHFKYNKPFKSLDQAEQHLQSVALVVEQLGFPDILHLSEVQDCQTLDRLVEALHGKLADSPYRAYMIRGTDTATGQNVGLITKIDPVSDLRRSGDRAEYPLDGSKCGYSEPIDGKRSTGVSKHYFTDFLINGQHKILLVGAHLIAFPSKRDRCEKREAQATLLANHIQKTVALSDTSIIIMGDFNDFDGEIDDAAGEADKPISSTLDILKKSTNPPLVNIASTWTNTTKRYSSWYDRNKSCKDDGGNEHTLIDHILVSSNLSAILVESYPLHSYKEFCGTLNSDHWPIFARFRLGDNYAQEDSGNEL